MTRMLAIFFSLMLAVSALAQDDIWSALRGGAGAYSNQRAAIRAAVEEFQAKMQAALAMPNDTAGAAEGVADVYPTQRAATEALVDAFVANVRSMPGLDEHGLHIVVTRLSQAQSGIPPLPGGNVNTSGTWTVDGTSGQMGQPTTDAAAQQAIGATCSFLQRRLPRARVMRDVRTAPVPDGSLVLGVGIGEIEHIRQSDLAHSEGSRGRMCLTFTTGGIERRLETRFDILHWAEDPAAFARQQPQEGWIVGRSTALFSNQADAIHSACDDAAAQFAQQTTGRATMYDNSVPFETLKVMALAHFVNGGTTDRFVQQFDTPGGNAWRAAVLVSSNDAAIRDVLPPGSATFQNVSARATGSSWLFNGSPFVMILMIVAIGVVLRLFTRGSSPSPSRGPAFGVMLVGLLAVVLLLMLFGVRRVSSTPAARVVMVR